MFSFERERVDEVWQVERKAGDPGRSEGRKNMIKIDFTKCFNLKKEAGEPNSFKMAFRQVC